MDLSAPGDGRGVRIGAPVALALFVFVSHASFLTLPYYWDELGQFVPAALDIFQLGAWIPRTTLPNVHPPGLMAYLACVWRVAGYSIGATRLAMLALAAAGTVIAFRLGIRLGLPIGAAITAVGLLVVSPLFFAQAMMAQLDMPVMVLFCLTLLLFLDGRTRAAGLASVALVMVKETGAIAPLVFGCWLWWKGRRRESMWFALPAIPLTLWLWALDRATEHLLGNAAFAAYNVRYPLEPVRLLMALSRRIYYLFAGSGHWIGTIALILAWRKFGRSKSREWQITASLAAAHVALVSLLGGAVLERYLMPVLPILYIVFSAAIWKYPVRWRAASMCALGAALVAANFWNPPYPFPLENNLAFTDFVKLHQDAAHYLEEHTRGKVATMFPLVSALRREEFGYVRRPLPVREIEDFTPASVAKISGEEDVNAFVLFDVAWDPWGLMQNARWIAFIRRYYGYEAPVRTEEAAALFHARHVARWERRGQWIEVYLR